MLATISRLSNHRAQSVVWAVLALFAGYRGLVPPSYDETWWLAVHARLELGYTLYESALDNKPPGIHLLVAALEGLSGEYRVSRAIFVGLLTVVLIWGVRRTGLGVPGSLVIVLVALGINGFALTVELVAATLLLVGWVILERWPIRGVLCCVAATLFDLRAGLIAAVVLLLLTRDETPARRTAGWIGVGAGMAYAVAVLVHPHLRFALIEYGWASRAVGPVSDLSKLAGLLVLVIILVGTVAWSPTAEVSRSGLAVVIASVTVAVGSLIAYPRYWTYAVVLAPVLVRSVATHRTQWHRLAVGVLAAIAMAPAAWSLAVPVESRLWERYGRIAESLADTERIVSIDRYPHLAALRPQESRLLAPVSWYIAVDTSRQEEFVSHLETELQTADAIVFDAALARPGPYWIGYQGIQPMLAGVIGEFEALFSDEHVVVLRRR